MNIFVAVSEAMRVEHKLVGGEEYTTVMAFDTFGSRRIVTCGNELPTATPCTLMIHLMIRRNDIMYRKVASFNTSCLEAHDGLFRLLMKGIFDPYVQKVH